MSASIASRPFFRIAIGSILLVWVFITIALMGNRYESKWYHGSVDTIKAWTANLTDSMYEETEEVDSALPISYQLEVPPKIGCDAIVTDLQHKLIAAYTELLKGIRYVNIWGYLETENKGDAAIWAAQQILLSMMGIQTDMACRYLNRCDVERFTSLLEERKPHSGIIMAGGGNFNDHYWDDQPSRIAMIDKYKDVPVRAFPQSVYMTKEDRINQTKTSFGQHPNLQLAARDARSYQWLADNMNQKAIGPGSQKIKSVLVPDIAFMWGSRADLRVETKKRYDLVILARDDKEISAGGDMHDIPFGTGKIDLGGDVGNITYWKFDWKFTHTRGIDHELPYRIAGKAQEEMPAIKDNVLIKKPKLEQNKNDGDEDGLDEEAEAAVADGSAKEQKAESKQRQKRDFQTVEAKTEFVEEAEEGVNQRAWAKAEQGFRELASGRFIITDRLHGHILSTILGVPHVVMDSKLGKNIDFHETWTKDCQCVRVAPDFESSLDVARLYFEAANSEGDLVDDDFDKKQAA